MLDKDHQVLCFGLTTDQLVIRTNENVSSGMRKPGIRMQSSLAILKNQGKSYENYSAYCFTSFDNSMHI